MNIFCLLSKSHAVNNVDVSYVLCGCFVTVSDNTLFFCTDLLTGTKNALWRDLAEGKSRCLMQLGRYGEALDCAVQLVSELKICLLFSDWLEDLCVCFCVEAPEQMPRRLDVLW